MGFFSGINFQDLAKTAANSFFTSQGVDTTGVLTPAGVAAPDAKAAVKNPPRNGTPVTAPVVDPGIRTTPSLTSSLHLSNPYVMGGIAVAAAIILYFALKK